VEVELKAPKIPYRETIRGFADVHGRHKKQTGGHGQFGDIKIKMEPLERGQKFEFVNAIFGGAVPKQFIPAVEKGIVEAADKGYLAGYPVVDFKVTLYDGQYHDVDSSEMSFKMAARKAFKLAMEQAKPTLLEPIMQAEVVAPVEYAGDLMSDLNTRRGPHSGHGYQGRNADREGAGSDVGDADVPERSDVDHAGAGVVFDGVFALRLCAAAASGEDHLFGAGGDGGGGGRRRVGRRPPSPEWTGAIARQGCAIGDRRPEALAEQAASASGRRFYFVCRGSGRDDSGSLSHKARFTHPAGG
jgi:hypothetical protein